MVNGNKILTNYIIYNNNHSYDACQKQFKLLFQTRIVLERAKRMMLASYYNTLILNY